MPELASKTSWTARRKAKFDVCIGSFGAQFHEWKARTEQPQWSTHYTQVRAIEALLVGVSDRVAEAAHDAAEDADFAQSLPQFERAMLSGWRVWEFFRSKLAQRQDEQFQPGLRAADELAWACRIPLAAAAAAAEKPVPKEPALVFLNGNASPVALARGRNFWAESAPGMGQLDSVCDDILKHVPVPLISLPWHEIWHIPSLTAVAHEAGHVVEEDFKLTDDLNAALTAAVAKAGGKSKEENWLRWRAEVFADFFAVRHCGPAYVGMLGDLLANVGPLGEVYPPAGVRMELCFEGLEKMGLKGEAAKRRTAWNEIAAKDADASELVAVKAVVEHLIDHKMPTLGGKSIGELALFGTARVEKAMLVKEDLARGIQPKFLAENALLRDGDPVKEQGIPQLLASAARLLYEDNPAAFNTEAASLEVIELIAAINAGVRRGTRRTMTEPAVSDEALGEAVDAVANLLLAKHAGKAGKPKPGGTAARRGGTGGTRRGGPARR
jgi:hypothetical protein